MHSIIISQKQRLLTDDDAVHRNVSIRYCKIKIIPPVSLLKTSSFYPQRKTKLLDLPYFLFLHERFLISFFKFLNVKNGWCDDVTRLLSTIFMTSQQGGCLGKISHSYRVWNLESVKTKVFKCPITVKSCTKAVAYVQIFNFLVRLLSKCSFYSRVA